MRARFRGYSGRVEEVGEAGFGETGRKRGADLDWKPAKGSGLYHGIPSRRLIQRHSRRNGERWIEPVAPSAQGAGCHPGRGDTHAGAIREVLIHVPGAARRAVVGAASRRHDASETPATAGKTPALRFENCKCAAKLQTRNALGFACRSRPRPPISDLPSTRRPSRWTSTSRLTLVLPKNLPSPQADATPKFVEQWKTTSF